MGVLVIAEPGMTWDRDLDKAYRLIDAAKECGADVCKFQWTSSGRKIQERRGVDPKYVAIYERGVQYPREWLELLKAHCDRVGIEFMCTTYLIEDIAVVAPLVKRFKVSAYEAKWPEFLLAHMGYGQGMIVSVNDWRNPPAVRPVIDSLLHCVSEYPAPLEHVGLRLGLQESNCCDGYSDHTANVLTGAAAVAAGAQIVEAHIRLWDTEPSNPDYGHSLQAETAIVHIDDNPKHVGYHNSKFLQYVRNIRTVERML